MGRIRSALRFTPLVLAAVLLGLTAVVGGGVESAVLVALLVIQALVLAVPRAARAAGRRIG